MKMRVFSIAYTATLALSAGAFAQSFRVLVREGDPVPGTVPGVTFASFSSVISAPADDIYFTATITGEGTNGAEDEVLIRSGPDGLTLIAREGRDAAGGTSGVTVGAPIFDVTANTARQVAFRTGGDNPGIWTTAPGVLTRLAGAGQTAPGVSGAAFGTLAKPALSATGVVVFHATLTGTTAPPSDDEGVWAGVDQPALIARKSGNAPQGVYASIDEREPRISDAGTITFLATITAPGMSPTRSVVLHFDNASSIALRVGDAVAGDVNEWFTQLNDPVVDASGRVAVRGSTRRNDGVQSSGVWILEDGVPRTIARNLTQALGVPAGTSYLRARRPQLIGADEFALATGYIGTIGSGRFGVYKGERLLLMQNAQAPGSPAGSLVTDLETIAGTWGNPMSVNRRGQVLITGRIYTPGSGTFDAIWLTDANDAPQLLATRGTIIDIDPGPATDPREVMSIWSRRAGVGVYEGFGAALSDRGEVPLGLVVTNVGGTILQNPPLQRVIVMASLPVTCDTIDFNRNGVFPEDQDVVDFFDVLAGGACSICGDIDFNNNFVFPEDADVIDFLRVFAGGPCP